MGVTKKYRVTQRRPLLTQPRYTGRVARFVFPDAHQSHTLTTFAATDNDQGEIWKGFASEIHGVRNGLKGGTVNGVWNLP